MERQREGVIETKRERDGKIYLNGSDLPSMHGTLG